MEDLKRLQDGYKVFTDYLRHAGDRCHFISFESNDFHVTPQTMTSPSPSALKSRKKHVKAAFFKENGVWYDRKEAKEVCMVDDILQTIMTRNETYSYSHSSDRLQHSEGPGVHLLFRWVCVEFVGITRQDVEVFLRLAFPARYDNPDDERFWSKVFEEDKKGQGEWVY